VREKTGFTLTPPLSHSRERERSGLMEVMIPGKNIPN
jgi:hypothetical protein